jgi:hypothetical protein
MVDAGSAGEDNDLKGWEQRNEDRSCIR